MRTPHEAPIGPGLSLHAGPGGRGMTHSHRQPTGAVEACAALPKSVARRQPSFCNPPGFASHPPCQQHTTQTATASSAGCPPPRPRRPVWPPAVTLGRSGTVNTRQEASASGQQWSTTATPRTRIHTCADKFRYSTPPRRAIPTSSHPNPVDELMGRLAIDFGQPPLVNTMITLPVRSTCWGRKNSCRSEFTDGTVSVIAGRTS